MYLVLSRHSFLPPSPVFFFYCSKVLIGMLGLKSCEDTVIGNEFVRGVSGGQRKRVTIGLDMLKGASLYFLDEPTTGITPT